MKEIASIELQNECVYEELNEDEVIVGPLITERVGWKWQEEYENMERSGFCTITLAMIYVLTREN